MSVIPQIRVNGGAPETGAIEAEQGDTIQLQAASYATWGIPVARYEIYDFPDAFTVPAGWSTSGSGDTTVFYWDGNGAPPSFVADEPGCYLMHLTATEDGQPVLAKIMVDIPLANGLKVIGRGEGELYGGTKLRWTKKLKELVHGIASIVAAAGAGVADYPYSAAIAPSIGAVHFVRVEPLTGNLTFNAPINLTDGAEVVFEVVQDGTGGRTVTWNAAFEMPDGIGYACPVPNARTRWVFVVDGSTMRCLCRQFSIGSISHTSGTPTLVPGLVNYISGTVTVPIVPAGAGWGGACNALTVKSANPGTIPVVLTRSGADTLNGATTFNVANAYGQAVVLSRGTSSLLVSPG